MRRLGGQALRFGGLCARGLLALALLLGLGIGALSWRLAQGPLHLPVLARALERFAAEDALGGGLAAGGAAGPSLHIGDVAIAWTGFREGQRSPLELRIANAQLRDASGAVRQSLPSGSVTLSFARLLRGQLAPARITLEGPSVVLERGADGQVTLSMGHVPVAGQPPPEAATPEEGEALLTRLLTPAAEDSAFAGLNRLQLRQGELTVMDRQLGFVWRLTGLNLSLQRHPGTAGASGEGEARLLLPGQDGGLPVRLTGSITGTPAAPVIQGRLSLPEVLPARLAGLAPALAPLALFDAPLALDLSGDFDGAAPRAEPRLRISARAGGGGVTAAGQRLGFAGLSLEAGLTPRELVLDSLRLELPPAVVPTAPTAESLPGTARRATEAAREVVRPGAPRAASRRPAPVIQASGGAALRDGRWRGQLEVALDQVEAPDLQAYWPPGVAPHPREWILENLTAGRFSEGRFTLKAEAAEDLSAPRLTDLQGSLRLADATVHWLRPIPPLEGGMATASFTQKEIEIRLEAARQSGSALTSNRATVRFLALDTDSEQMEIEARLRGPVADTLTLLKHPRLKLFEKRPLTLSEPGGQVEATLRLGMPLLADIPAEAVRVGVQAKLTGLRLADVLMGKTLDRGTADLTLDNARLRANGTAQLAGIPTRLSVEMDFRNGPANQVVERIRAEARPDASRIAEFGLDLEGLVSGPVAVEALLEKRRNLIGSVRLNADLGASRMLVPPLAWSKPPGQAASAQGQLRLEDGSLVGVESFTVQAPELLARGRASFGPGSRLEKVELREAAVGRSRFAGEALVPLQRGAPWRVRLSGALLDLGPVLSQPDDPPGSTSNDSIPVAGEGRFERVLLGGDRALTVVQGRALADSRGVLREARVTGHAGRDGAFDLSVAPAGAGRTLQLRANDAGALLQAFDVLHQVRGGQLVVTGRYASNAPGAALHGRAEMNGFSFDSAAGIGKLLQALTVYGVFDAVRGPGLAFDRMVAPFSLTPEALSVEDARAFSASLGVTAKGQILRRQSRVALEGTIVPAYVINSLLGQIPLLGRLFSPERGGGLFAATWSMRGPTDDPVVTVNPLAALTPGFLRGIFGIGGGGDGKPVTPTPPAAQTQ